MSEWRGWRCLAWLWACNTCTAVPGTRWRAGLPLGRGLLPLLLAAALLLPCCCCRRASLARCEKNSG